MPMCPTTMLDAPLLLLSMHRTASFLAPSIRNLVTVRCGNDCDVEMRGQVALAFLLCAASYCFPLCFIPQVYTRSGGSGGGSWTTSFARCSCAILMLGEHSWLRKRTIHDAALLLRLGFEMTLRNVPRELHEQLGATKGRHSHDQLEARPLEADHELLRSSPARLVRH